MRRVALLLLLAVALFAVVPAPGVLAHGGEGDHPTDDELLAAVSFDQRLNSQMPLDAPLIDEQGREVNLRGLLKGKPAVMVFNYYNCPTLCPVVMQGLTESLRTMRMDAGREFSVISLSIDPRETPDLSTATKAATLARYGRYGSQDGWHFLTAPETSIQQLADAAGFHYAYDPDTGQYAHPTGIFVMTPEGRLSKYLYGLEFSPRDLRLAVVDASAGKIGTAVDQILLRCFHYDPTRGQYTVAINNILKAASAATMVGVGAMVLLLSRKSRRPAA